MFDPADLLSKVIAVAVLLLVGFPVHEFAHAAAAYWQGDAMAKVYGRLTLNPIAHFDRMGAMMTVFSVLLGGIVIGWAKPTPVNPMNLRDRKNGEVIVALAGPASNIVMAVGFGLLFRVLVAAAIPAPDWVYIAIYYLVLFNVLLGIFNLLPVPPLDGSTLIYRFLSPKQAWQLRPLMQQYGFFILLGIVLIAGPALSSLIGGVARALVGA